MKLEIKTNFNFGRLAEKFKNIQNDYLSDFSAGSAESTKGSIDDGLQPLTDVTKQIRKIKGISGNTPLKATGKLYNSIKNKKNALVMEKYGIYHQEGFTPKKKPLVINKKVVTGQGGKPFFVNNTSVTVPARPFISIDAKNKSKLDRKFVNDLNKALRTK